LLNPVQQEQIYRMLASDTKSSAKDDDSSPNQQEMTKWPTAQSKTMTALARGVAVIP